MTTRNGLNDRKESSIIDLPSVTFEIASLPSHLGAFGRGGLRSHSGGPKSPRFMGLHILEGRYSHLKKRNSHSKEIRDVQELEQSSELETGRAQVNDSGSVFAHA